MEELICHSLVINLAIKCRIVIARWRKNRGTYIKKDIYISFSLDIIQISLSVDIIGALLLCSMISQYFVVYAPYLSSHAT